MLIYKRLEEKLIKPAAGNGKVLSPGDTKYLFISPLNFHPFFPSYFERVETEERFEHLTLYVKVWGEFKEPRGLF